MTQEKYTYYVNVLKDELVPAMGCTEPIAIAYAAAILRHTLGGEPSEISVGLSGNIIKNVRCVRIPNSRGMTGIEAACALGAIAGDSARLMEVLEAVTPEGLSKTLAFLSENRCRVDKETKREEVKQLIYHLSQTYPDLKERIFGAMQRYPLEEWGPQGRYKRPKDQN